MISNPVLVLALVLSLALTTKTCSWVLIQDPFFFFSKDPFGADGLLGKRMKRRKRKLEIGGCVWEV